MSEKRGIKKNVKVRNERRMRKLYGGSEGVYVDEYYWSKMFRGDVVQDAKEFE